MSDNLLLFGQIALRNHLLTQAQLEEALKLQELLQKKGVEKSLGEVCIHLGYLTQEQVEKILEAQKRSIFRDEGKLYGKIAVKNGFLTKEQVEQALLIQHKEKYTRPIGHYLLQLGYIQPSQHRSILKAIERLRQTKKQEASSFPLIPGYRILKKIGEGGMGTVYKAVQLSLEKKVAIKVLAKELLLDPVKLERFQREAKILAKLDHPGIIKVLDRGQIGDTAYYVMEYVEGETLDKIIKRRGKLQEEEALKITKAVAEALSHAWKYHIVHRDIKPENILISKEGAIKLCDLGVAKCLEPENLTRVTAHGITVGTPLYMSPEQARGLELDIRTDIYALGITLYEMLTGKPPFFHNSPLQVMQMHLRSPLPSLSRANPLVSKETVRLVEKMTEKKREKRIQTPEEVVQIIDNILKGEKKSPFSQKLKKIRKKFPRRRL